MGERALSSYEKGIRKLLQRREAFEWIMANYIIETNNKFKSNVFPTTQVAKIVLGKLGKEKTKFPIIHKIVREIFKIWEQQQLCEAVRGGIRNEKKTKRVYRITDYGFTVLKSKIIGFNIQKIEGRISEEFEPEIRSREEIIRSYLEDLIYSLEDIDTYDEEDEEDEEDED